MVGSYLLVLLAAGECAAHLRRHLLEVLLQPQVALRRGGQANVGAAVGARAA